MRSQEFVNDPIVATYYIGGMVVPAKQHTIVQRNIREVTDAKVTQALRKLIYIERKMRKIQGGHKFWVDDVDTGISLGMRRSSIDADKFYFNTVVATRTYDSDVPVIAMPSMQFTEEQLDELSFLGSTCTRDCSGHRAGYRWYQQQQRDPQSWSPSFNRGAALARDGK